MLLKTAVFELQLHTDCSRQPGGMPGSEKGEEEERDRVRERERGQEGNEK